MNQQSNLNMPEDDIRAIPSFSTQFPFALPRISIEGDDSDYELLLAVWRAACETVERLSGKFRARWPGAVEALHDYGLGIRIRFRDDADGDMFEGVILGAWERARGFTGSQEIIKPEQAEA